MLLLYSIIQHEYTVSTFLFWFLKKNICSHSQSANYETNKQTTTKNETQNWDWFFEYILHEIIKKDSLCHMTFLLPYISSISYVSLPF